MKHDPATEEALAGLHAKLAETLADAIEQGVPVKDEKTGEILKAPASAAILNVARQFLKDNDIKSLPAGKTPLERLAGTIPAGFELPVEGDERPTH